MKQPLTTAQSSLLDALRLTNTDNRALEIVEAAMRFRNAIAPSGVLNRNDAQQELVAAIDKAS